MCPVRSVTYVSGRSKNLAESRLALPVRSQSAIFRRDPVQFLTAMMVKDLNSNYLSLSPLSVRFCVTGIYLLGMAQREFSG
jgi:hypothetical protein